MMRKKQFPIGEASEAAETARFVNSLSAQRLPRLQELSKYVESEYTSLDSLIQIERESWEALALMFAGLGPGHRERFLEWLVPKLAKFEALRAKTRQKAEERIRRHKERANGHH